MHINSNCVGCGLCVDECKFGAISLVENRAVIDQDLCKECGRCATVCQFNALDFDDPVKRDSLKNYANAVPDNFSTGVAGRGAGMGCGQGRGRGSGCGGARGQGRGMGTGRMNNKGAGRGKGIFK
ncbi:MAG: 4Fe-4S binding protein [Bacillota bacterium]|nr:4Fe-4S binding protein [Bacillota bacterium]